MLWYRLGMSSVPSTVYRILLIMQAWALSLKFRIPSPPLAGDLYIICSSGLRSKSVYNQLFIILVILLESSTLKSTEYALNQIFDRQYWFSDQLWMLSIMYLPAFHWKEITRQAGAELGQAQLKLELVFTLIFFRFGLIELTSMYSCSYW